MTSVLIRPEVDSNCFAALGAAQPAPKKPSLKKSLRARTTGKYKRRIKKAINPFYGKRGMGFIKNPRRSIRNKIYHKTTFGLSDIFMWLRK